MALIEVYEDKDATQPLFVTGFDFTPRVGEYLARDTDGYFRYYKVVEVWHRQDAPQGTFRACLRVTLDD